MSNLLNCQAGTLALDFDGVICDGLREYFQASWLAYRQIWPTSVKPPPPELEAQFKTLRPIVTHGWEMPLVLRGLIKGYRLREIQSNWSTIKQRILTEEDLSWRHLGQTLDRVRDEWIKRDWQGWLGLHQFYPGVVAQLQAWEKLALPLVIITTKETRFVEYLLEQAEVKRPCLGIYGKDCPQTKVEVLLQLQETVSLPIWFVEDRLAALESVQQEPRLSQIQLFLAAWGYTTSATCAQAQGDNRITLLQLTQFCQDFSAWMPKEMP